jgi:phosphoribosylaminoimidazole-succinocarboxamide synthase
MTNADALFEIDIPTLTRIARGKVRDIFAIDDEHLLIVTTDRLSAYDVVMPDPIPGKGQVLTELSNFWFSMMQDLVPNHLTDLSIFDVISDAELAENLQPRSMLVRRLKPLPIEAVVRGYLIGSGWTDYLKTGAVCGIELPSGLEQAARLPETTFTPATKAAVGDHDENVSFEQVVSMIGEPLAIQVRDIAIKIYERAATFASERGIIIADTKFEFGQDDDGRLFIIDEILTPDSSRFWPASEYRTGISPPSFDKQFVRDYLETLDWDKTSPGPTIPADILQRSGDKYREVRQILVSPQTA